MSKQGVLDNPLQVAGSNAIGLAPQLIMPLSESLAYAEGLTGEIEVCNT